VCQETPALAPRMESVRTTQVTSELQEVGLEAVRTAGRDTLCAMAVQAAAQHGVDVNTWPVEEQVAGDEEPYETRLEVASCDGLAETIRALVAAGADQDYADINGNTALYAAAHQGHVEAIQALTAAGADVNHANLAGGTALYGAAWNGHMKAIWALLVAGAEVDYAASERYTALYAAALNGHVEALVALVAAGAEVKHADNEGNTALYAAAHQGHVDAIQVCVCSMCASASPANRDQHASVHRSP
jgi:ankyrin repeat protein